MTKTNCFYANKNIQGEHKLPTLEELHKEIVTFILINKPIEGLKLKGGEYRHHSFGVNVRPIFTPTKGV